MTLQATVKSVPLTLITSHLESTASHTAERKRQLKVAFDTMKKQGNTIIFGGDLNLRDKEVCHHVYVLSLYWLPICCILIVTIIFYCLWDTAPLYLTLMCSIYAVQCLIVLKVPLNPVELIVRLRCSSEAEVVHSSTWLPVVNGDLLILLPTSTHGPSSIVVSGPVSWNLNSCISTQSCFDIKTVLA